MGCRETKGVQFISTPKKSIGRLVLQTFWGPAEYERCLCSFQIRLGPPGWKS